MAPVPEAPKGRLTLATWLTLSRMGLSVPVILAILWQASALATLLLAVAAITDFLDGYIARARGEESVIGAALDPVADKVLTLAALVAFIAGGTLTGPHLLPVFAIVLRETLIAGLRESLAGQGTLAVIPMAKMKTTVQFLALLALCWGPSTIALALLWVSAGLTLWTGTIYVRAWAANVSR